VATPESLIEQGNVALSRLEPELAVKFFSAALKLSPTDTNIMDALADVHIQVGDSDSALELLSQSTQLAPSENSVKWLYLAQLREGDEALLCYRTGIRLLEETEAAAGDRGDPQSADSTKKQISRAYCSIAELFLTDLCYDDGAENSCEAAVQDSLRFDAGNLETYQTLASLRLSQCRGQEASEVILRVVHQVLEVRERLHRRTLAADLTAQDGAETELDVPTVEASTATVKLCLECVPFNTQLAQAAVALTNNLLAEDDEVIELWYLLGLASQQLPDPDLVGAVDALEMAKELLEQIREQIRLEGGGVDSSSSNSSSSNSDAGGHSQGGLAPDKTSDAGGHSQGGLAPDKNSDAGGHSQGGLAPDKTSTEECSALTEAEFYEQQYKLVTEQLETLSANPALLSPGVAGSGTQMPSAGSSVKITPTSQAAEQIDEEWSTEDEMET